MLELQRLYPTTRLIYPKSEFLCHAYSHEMLKLYAHDRYTDEEVNMFNSIMKLERGFKGIVQACITDTDAFHLLITEVCDYMRHISSLVTCCYRFQMLQPNHGRMTQEN
jgi:hypothetical protein